MSEVTLEEHISVLSGFAFPSSSFSQTEGLPLIRIRDLANKSTEIRFKGKYPVEYLVSNGDILIGMDGDFEIYRWNGGTALLNQRVCKIIPIKSKLDQNFAFWYLKPKIFEIHRKTPQTTVRHLSTKDIYRIEAPSHTLPQQLKIAHILDTLDRAIEKTEAIIAKLKLMKQGLLHDLLTRGIGADGQLRPPQSEAPELYKDSPLGWIPKEWEVISLDQKMRRITYGFTSPMPTTESGAYMITATDINDGVILYNQARRTSYNAYRLLSSKSRPQKGDILITKDGTLGRVAVVDKDDICINQSVAILSPKNIVESLYLINYLQSDIGQFRILADSGGSTIKHIYISKLAKMEVPWPNSLESEKIHLSNKSISWKIFNSITDLEKLKLKKFGLINNLLINEFKEK